MLPVCDTLDVLGIDTGKKILIVNRPRHSIRRLLSSGVDDEQ
jgi:hypothetical protein